MAPIKAVLFDYGMVLSGAPDAAAWARLRTITSLPEEILHREYWAHRHAYDRGNLTAKTYWHKVAEGAGITLTPTQLTQLIAADTDFWSTLNLPMIEWAKHLQRSGIRIGILSNMPDAMETGLRARHPWIDTFDHNTWSHAINIAKPEPAIYLHAAKGLHIPPENILFLDDRSENIEGAIAVGMQAIQYTTHQAFQHEMQARGLDSRLQPEKIQLEGHIDSQNGKL